MKNLLAALFLFCTAIGFAQAPLPSVEDAKQAIAAKPNDPAAWENLGLALLTQNQPQAAVEPLKKAVELGYPAAVGNYNLACAYARMNTAEGKEKAFALLTAIVAKPGGGQFQLAADPDLASLRSDPRFQQIVNDQQAGKYPCQDHQKHPEYRQLDFWVGEWDVFNTLQQKVGTSSVQSILKDCVVYENWKDGVGGEGKSFNKFNPSLQKWEQFWVADTGTTTHYTGALEGDRMVYLADTKTAAGAPYLQRLSFTPLAADKVRQFAEISTDGGKTWSVGYDFTYMRKKQAEVPGGKM